MVARRRSLFVSLALLAPLASVLLACAVAPCGAVDNSSLARNASAPAGNQAKLGAPAPAGSKTKQTPSPRGTAAAPTGGAQK